MLLVECRLRLGARVSHVLQLLPGTSFSVAELIMLTCIESARVQRL